jgi:hypothetical protein
MLFPGAASSSRIIALKTSPRIPEKAPKRIYRVPISLWFVE